MAAAAAAASSGEHYESGRGSGRGRVGEGGAGRRVRGRKVHAASSASALARSSSAIRSLRPLPRPAYIHCRIFAIRVIIAQRGSSAIRSLRPRPRPAYTHCRYPSHNRPAQQLRDPLLAGPAPARAYSASRTAGGAENMPRIFWNMSGIFWICSHVQCPAQQDRGWLRLRTCLEYSVICLE